MSLAGADTRRELHLQLVGAERAGQGGKTGILGQPQQIPEVNTGAQGGGKQQNRMRRLEPFPQEIRRNEVKVMN